MRTLTRALGAGALMLLLPTLAWAQLELPQPSLAAKVSQRVGLTDVDIDYSSPAVRGRKIWGALVPHGQYWRAGANAPTTVTFSQDVKVGGKAVPAGTYRVGAIPGAKTWTLIINGDLSGGGNAHNPKADVARVSLEPTAVPHRERLTYFFNNTTDEGTELTLEWEKLALVVPVQVNTVSQAEQNITAALSQAWRPHFSAGRYYQGRGDLKKALAMYDASIAIEGTWWNHWFKAQILGQQGKKGEARTLATQAQKLGAKDAVYQGFFAKDVEAALKDWSR